MFLERMKTTNLDASKKYAFIIPLVALCLLGAGCKNVPVPAPTPIAAPLEEQETPAVQVPRTDPIPKKASGNSMDSTNTRLKSDLSSCCSIPPGRLSIYDLNITNTKTNITEVSSWLNWANSYTPPAQCSTSFEALKRAVRSDLTKEQIARDMMTISKATREDIARIAQEYIAQINSQAQVDASEIKQFVSQSKNTISDRESTDASALQDAVNANREKNDAQTAYSQCNPS